MHKVLEVFPCGVMINSYKNGLVDEKINFTNIEFIKQIKKLDNRIEELDSIDVEFEQFTGNSLSKVSCDLHTYLRSIHSKLRDNQIFEQNNVSAKIKIEELNHGEENIDEVGEKERQYIFSIKIMKVEWEGRKCFLNVFSDNTSILKLEKAKTSIKQQKTMFASASHEFRTPLNAIINSFGFIERSIETLSNDVKNQIASQSPQIMKFIKIGTTSSTLLLSLIEDILNLSKIEAGTFTIIMDSFNIGELMEEIYDIFSFQCNQKRIELNMTIDKSLKLTNIITDRGRVKQILLNLMSNSLKFTFEGSITITVRTKRTTNGKKIEF